MTTLASTLGSNATMAERVRYGEHVPAEDIADALDQLAALVAALDDANLTTDNPATLIDELDALQTASCVCNNEHHSDYDDLKEFFEACVFALNKNWPCAEAYDLDLRDVITTAIARGDVEEV